VAGVFVADPEDGGGWVGAAAGSEGRTLAAWSQRKKDLREVTRRA
jgi:hypothetical protein